LPLTADQQANNIECPEGEVRVDVKKGRRLCCPQKKELMDIVNGKAVCCAPGENHQKGASICCPRGESYSKLHTVNDHENFKRTSLTITSPDTSPSNMRLSLVFLFRLLGEILNLLSVDRLALYGLSVLITSCPAHGVRVRYTELGAKYVGTFKPEKPVGTLHDCTAMAYRGKAIGYRIHMEDDKMKCALLKEFVRFEALEDSEVRDYILTTNLDDNSCPATRNVTNFLSKPCDPEIGDCASLEQIADYCLFVGSDIANCVCRDLALTHIVIILLTPAPKLTLRDLECPVGQERVDLKKEKRLCCPVGEKLAEERDGKAFCCPQKKELKDVVGGKAVCCAPGENHKKGTTLCCPPGESYSKLENTEICCPNGRTLSKSSKGTFGCCPTGEHFEKNEGGVDHCCEAGLVLKGFNKAQPVCCESAASFQEGICCTDGLVGSRASDGHIGCCMPSTTAFKGSDGLYRCCPNNKKCGKD
uniref:EGF-like domain-containing protein n=1 Tax=Steinernema glaseri TaxID=37863 RepID=A0A1I7Y9U6_9BILA